MRPHLEIFGVVTVDNKGIVDSCKWKPRMVPDILTYTVQTFGKHDYLSYGIHIAEVETSICIRVTRCYPESTRHSGLPVSVWSRFF